MVIALSIVAFVGTLVMVLGAISLISQFENQDASSRAYQFTRAEQERAQSSESGASGSRRAADRLEQSVGKRSFANRIRADLLQADLKMTVGEFLMLQALTTVFGFLVGTFLMHTVILGVVVGIVGFFAPRFYVRFRKRRRLRMFDSQLGDTITLMSNGLRAGYSIVQSLQMVAREAPSPSSDEFERLVIEIGLGLPAETALLHLVERLQSEDLDMMVTAIVIQREVGGNLAEILDTISATIRERAELKGKIQTLTAQQTLGGYVILAMPLAMAAILFVISPSYVNTMVTTSCGISLSVMALIFMAIGWFAMRKIVDIKV